MLLLGLALFATSELWLRECGHMVDAEALRQELGRVRSDRGELTLTCLGDRMLLHLSGEAIPSVRLVGVAEAAADARAAYIARAISQPELHTAPSPEDLRELVLTPRAGDVALVVRAEDRSKRVPLSLLEKEELCRTPCVLHTRPGKLDWIRGGLNSGMRRAPDRLEVPPDGGDVWLRAPSTSAFATGAVITAIGAAMDLIGILTFALGLSPLAYDSIAGLTGFILWMTADLAVLPIGIVLMRIHKLGQAKVVEHDSQWPPGRR